MRACSLPRTSCLFVGDSRHRLLLPVWCVPGDHPANAAPGSGISPSRRGFTWTWVWATAWPAARRSLRPIVNPSGPRPARSRRRTSPTNFQTAAARRWAARRGCSRVSGHHEAVHATDRVGVRDGDCRHCSWVRARQVRRGVGAWHSESIRHALQAPFVSGAAGTVACLARSSGGRPRLRG